MGNWLTSKSFKLMIMIVLALMLSAPPLNAHAQAQNSTSKNPKILVVYSTKNGQINEDVRSLEMLVNHFSTNTAFKNVKQVQKSDFNGVQYLFYFGGVQQSLLASFTHLVSQFQGKTVVIGANAAQLGFQFIGEISKVDVDKIQIHSKTISLPTKMEIYQTNPDQSSKVLMTASDGTQKFPLFVQTGNRYYFFRIQLSKQFDLALGHGLNHVFSVTASKEHPTYLRLEDVSPKADPKKLMAIAKYLKKQDIPYMIAVIPVFVNPKSGTRIHMKDDPKVVKALRYMQKNGGSVLMHGYTHQYRQSETGEGFEFWDVKHNTPILAPANAKKRIGLSYEKKYINRKLTKGIQELTSVGLYPVGFEAPHYVMSQEGYKIVSHYFSTYVGQIQVSKKDWHGMRTTPFITQPHFLGGMKLYPETIGYVPLNDPNGVENMVNKAKKQLVVNDSVIGGFYHPYLGLEQLKKLIRQMKKLPHLKWINLQTFQNTVQAPKVHIRSGKSGIEVDTSMMKISFSNQKTSLSSKRTATSMKKTSRSHLGPWLIAFSIVFIGGIIFLLIKATHVSNKLDD